MREEGAGGTKDLTAQEIATGLIAKWEGFSERAYLCPAGYWTIGYGFRWVDGKEVTEDTPRMSQVEAQARLASEVAQVMRQVARETKGVSLGKHQTAALVSFVFNLGLGALQRSTLLKHLKAGSPKKAGEEFEKWIMARGGDGLLRPVEGLRNRRKEERALFERDLGAK